MIEELYTRQKITAELQSVSMVLIKWSSEQPDEQFGMSLDEKWSTAEQIDHLTKSIKPLNTILSKPKFFVKMLFGLANRDSRKYQVIVDKYKLKLGQGGRATKPFLPKSHRTKDKKKLLARYAAESQKLERIIKSFTEKDLDKYVIPHPLLGKLTVREMLFFTIYHTMHHHHSLTKLYK